MNLTSLNIIKRILPQLNQKHVSDLSSSCQKKHFYRTISRRPRTAFLKRWESKCQYIPVNICSKNFVLETQEVLKASTLIVRSAIRAFTEKLRRPNNIFLQVALYLLLVILIVDSYFALFMGLFFSAQKCAHLTGKNLIGIGNREIRTSANIVLMTLYLALISFPIGTSFIFKDTS